MYAFICKDESLYSGSLSRCYSYISKSMLLLGRHQLWSVSILGTFGLCYDVFTGGLEGASLVLLFAKLLVSAFV